ncbi:MAG: LLM class flavin-dependent oxidoreductase [Gammaproteobacteria bacterium]|nr:LLM class flavin-dependent oxidoreductase [Gammaproteobacteria bacterium]
MTKLGYLVPTREYIMTGKHETSALIEEGRQAQSLGFDSLWVGDSLFARPRHDPLTLLAGFATAIPGVELGTAVLLAALRNPIILAQQLATIDQLSEGRLVVGVGIGADTPSIHAEFAAAGVPFERRVGRLVESMQLCKALWQGEPVSWEGRWQLSEVTLGPKPYRAGGPPIWYASSVDAGVKRAGEYFDGWLPIGPDTETIARQHKLLDDETTTAVYVTLCIHDDTEEADRQIDEYMVEYYKVPAKVMRRMQVICSGDADTVMASLRSLVDAGADHLIVRVIGDTETTLATIAERRSNLN